MELQGLQDQLKALESERERISQQGLDTSFQDATIRDVKQHIADLESQQNLQVRVEQAKETGYILDTIEIDGMPAISFSHTPENHELLAIAVQKLFIAQEDAFNVSLSSLQWRNDSQAKIIENGTADNQRLIWENGNLRDTLAQANIEKEDAYLKLANATDIITEKDIEIKRLKELQTSTDAVPVAPLSEEEKETKLIAEVMGKQIKVTNVRAKADTFDNKVFIAVNVITGVEFEDYYIYLCKLEEDKPKRYKEISEEAAEQLRADYANKKAELEAQIAVIPTIETEIEYVNAVTEQEAPAQEVPFQPEEEIRSAAFGLADQSLSLPGEKSEVDNKRTNQVSPEDFEWLDHVVSKLIISLKEKDILPSDWEAAA